MGPSGYTGMAGRLQGVPWVAGGPLTGYGDARRNPRGHGAGRRTIRGQEHPWDHGNGRRTPRSHWAGSRNPGGHEDPEGPWG